MVMIMTNLWKSANYRSKCRYLIDTEIYEYDISKANISVLREANAISQDMYDYLYAAPKQERSVTIGKLQGSDPKITEILKNGIANARKIFLESNQIEDSRILAIRNDAITYVGRPAEIVSVTPYVNFRQSGRYSSFYHINTIDYLYFYDVVTRNEGLDIKGLGESAVDLHRHYMLEFLTELFYTAQIEGVENTILLLNLFRNNYINKKLDINYYRELNPGSRFKLANMSTVSTIYADWLTDYDKRYIDIGFNENILREFIKIFSSIYFKKG